MKAIRSIYLLTHTPVHIYRPLQVGFVQKATWSDALFEKYQQGVEENRKAECGRRFLSKKDIERWGFMPPCGARFEVVELDLTWLPVEGPENPMIESICGTKKPTPEMH